MTSFRAVLVAVAVSTVVVAGCASADGSDGLRGSNGSNGSVSSPILPGGDAGDGASAADCDAAAVSGPLTVFAAASLKASFDELRSDFVAEYPCVDFSPITYDGSSTLATQIGDGAPADVFASANEANMDKVAALVTGRDDFATNSLQIATAPGNPKHIDSLADLAKNGVVTVVCAPQVPCGDASQTALSAAGVDLTPASEEQNVTAVLTKVSTGNADAGLVYATDVNSADGAVTGIDFPEAAEAINTYPIAILKDSDHVAAADAFVAFVRSDTGQQVLADVGFGRP